MSGHDHLPLRTWREYPPETMLTRAREFADQVALRRTVRDFSDRPLPEGLLREAIRAAGCAPSGANQQPWHFVVVSDPEIKKRIREGAEAEEREFYEHRAPDPWLKALEPLGTDASKPFLEVAPALIAVFQQRWGLDEQGERIKHYYPLESTGLATGLLITALHHAGLVSLTHTPSPMNFLNEILGRPENERPFLLLVVGYPSEDAQVPDIQRKPLAEIATFLEEQES